MATLKADPDWIGAAQDFVSALEAQPDADGRVEVVEAVRDALGDQIYPAFIKLLAAVARFADAPARKLAADAFAHALSTSKLPSVRLPAFGGGAPPASAGAFSALGGGHAGGGIGAPPTLGGGGLLTNLRAVGPIEFLCLWSCRDVGGEPLSPEAFETALTWLLRLFDASPRAAVLYQARLSTDVEGAREGLHDRESRAVVRALIEAWEGGAEPQAAAAAARGALRSNPFAALPAP